MFPCVHVMESVSVPSADASYAAALVAELCSNLEPAACQPQALPFSSIFLLQILLLSEGECVLTDELARAPQICPGLSSMHTPETPPHVDTDPPPGAALCLSPAPLQRSVTLWRLTSFTWGINSDLEEPLEPFPRSSGLCSN